MVPTVSLTSNEVQVSLIGTPAAKACRVTGEPTCARCVAAAGERGRDHASPITRNRMCCRAHRSLHRGHHRDLLFQCWLAAAKRVASFVPVFLAFHLGPDQAGDLIEALLYKYGNFAGQGKVLLALLEDACVPVVFLLLGAQLRLCRQEFAGSCQILVGELLTFTLELERARLFAAAEIPRCAGPRMNGRYSCWRGRWQRAGSAAGRAQRPVGQWQTV
jgi:hypothetical protein